MFALIKREIADTIVFFVITAISTIILVSFLVYSVAVMPGSDHAFGVPSIMYKIFKSFHKINFENI